VLYPAAIHIAIEAASAFGWQRWVGSDGAIVAMDRFGACGRGIEVLE
jgi:transketolase